MTRPRRFRRLLAVSVALALLGSLGYLYSTGILIKDSVLTVEEVESHYQTVRPEIVARYRSGGHPVALEYSNWPAAATTVAAPGVHSSRYLATFVNRVGYDQYIEYASDDFEMPLGTVIAKESFKLKAQARKLFVGPLLIMEKVGLSVAPESNGWVYQGVKGNGRTMNVSQKYCHGCHGAFADQDSLGYPVKSMRIGYASEGTPEPSVQLGAGDPARGKEFFTKCASCHQIGADAQNGFGPTLNNVVDHLAGASSGYAYSASLEGAKNKGLVWDEEHLFEWLAGPSELLKKHLGKSDARSKMRAAFDDVQGRQDVIAYLRSLSAGS